MAEQGLFYARLEDKDWKFLGRLTEPPPFDAAVVKAGYLAPYPDDDSRHGEAADRLSATLVEKEWPWALDPATAAHGHPRAAEWTAPRARNCLLAQTTDLPWVPDDLGDSDLVAELIDRAVTLQTTSPAIAAPYLETVGVEDPAIDVNCSLLSLTAERAADQRVLTYLQTLSGSLLDGSAAAVAERYVAAGAQTIFIRIRRFNPLSLEQVVAYLDLVERIEGIGARAVADSVGHFGAVAVAGGAYAFSAGARFFRKVPDALLQKCVEPAEGDGEKSGGGGPPILYEHPGQLVGIHLSEAGPHLQSCPEVGCRAEGGAGKPHYLREHNLHEFRRLARQAGERGLGFAEILRAIGRPETALWAEALDQRAAQRRAA